MKTKKPIKKTVVQPEETLEELPFVPPEIHELSERYTIRVPLRDLNLDDRWHLRLYAEKVLEDRLGDTVQLTSMRVHKPHLLAKSKARLFKREPQARLLVTIKF